MTLTLDFGLVGYQENQAGHGGLHRVVVVVLRHAGQLVAVGDYHQFMPCSFRVSAARLNYAVSGALAVPRAVPSPRPYINPGRSVPCRPVLLN